MNHRRIQEHNDRMSMAWHIAAMTRSKKLPRLDTLLTKPKSVSRRQTWEEQMAIMKSLSARINQRASKRGQTAGEAAHD